MHTQFIFFLTIHNVCRDELQLYYRRWIERVDKAAEQPSSSQRPQEFPLGFKDRDGQKSGSPSPEL